LMKRRWDGDVYAALRDCLAALSLQPDHIKAHLRMARCLADLDWRDEASACLTSFRSKHPEHRRSVHCVELEQDLAKGREDKRGETRLLPVLPAFGRSIPNTVDLCIVWS